MSTDGTRILNRLSDLEKMVKKMKKEIDIIKDSVLRIEGAVSPAWDESPGLPWSRFCTPSTGVCEHGIDWGHSCGACGRVA